MSNDDANLKLLQFTIVSLSFLPCLNLFSDWKETPDKRQICSNCFGNRSILYKTTRRFLSLYLVLSETCTPEQPLKGLESHGKHLPSLGSMLRSSLVLPGVGCSEHNTRKLLNTEYYCNSIAKTSGNSCTVLHAPYGPTLRLSTLVKSSRKSFLAISTWNLCPQFFTHVSKTCEKKTLLLRFNPSTAKGE